MAQKINPPSESKLERIFIVFIIIFIILCALSLVLYVCSVFGVVPGQNATISFAFAFAWLFIGCLVLAFNYYLANKKKEEQNSTQP